MESKVRQWVRVHLAERLGIEPAAIHFDQGLDGYGLDSVDAILMAGELETALNLEIDPAAFLQHPNLEAMIQSLEHQLQQSRERSGTV